jgi:modulator of FtsH protease HflC
MKTAAVIAALLVAVLLASSSPYAVDQAEFAYVTQFGRHVATRDGATDAGLHFKWPWPIQSVQRIDRRLQMFDLSAAELPTFDPQGQTIDKMLTVDGYVAWQIADERGVDQFIRAIGTPERAREILGPRIAGRVGAAISQMRLDDLIHVSPVEGRQADLDARGRLLEQRLLDTGGPADLRKQVREEYGIALVDVRLRRLNYPDSVRQAIFDRIRSERKLKAADYESDGEKRAREIRTAADRDAEIMRSTAQARADLIRRQADADADKIRNEAHAKDRDFYVFLQKLETYKQMLAKTSDLLLLSSRHPLFQLLLNPPNGPPGSDKRPNGPGDRETRRQGDKEIMPAKPGG